MDCSEAQEYHCDLNRGKLEASTAAAVRAHLERCAECASAYQVEIMIRGLVRARAPRYTAPADLRSRIQALLAESASTAESVSRGAAAGRRRTTGSSWRDWLRAHRWMAGSLAAGMTALLLVWTGALMTARDPVSLLAARAVAEHVEYTKETMRRPAADPATVIRELKSQTALALDPVFPGDSQVELVDGKVTDLHGKRAAAFIYRDTSGRYTTLFLMPEAGTSIPADGRLPIETFRPYRRLASGRQLLLWKQRDLACLLVSDLDEAGTAQMFLKVRKGV